MSIQFDNEYDNEIMLVFLEEVEGYLPELEDQLTKLNQQPKDKDALEVAHRLAHTIKGTAASLGFDEVSKHGLALEQALTPVIEKKAVFTPQLAQACEIHVADLKRLLAVMHTRVENGDSFMATEAAAPASFPPGAGEPTVPQTKAADIQQPIIPQSSYAVEASSSLETGSAVATNSKPENLQPETITASTPPAVVNEDKHAPARSWLEDAADLFSFDDLQPLDFVQRIEQRQQSSATTSLGQENSLKPDAVANSASDKSKDEVVFDLPDWLREAQAAVTTTPDLPAKPEMPLLDTAGVHEPDPNANLELDLGLPSLDDLPDFAQLEAQPAQAAKPDFQPDLHLLPLDEFEPFPFATNPAVNPAASPTFNADSGLELPSLEDLFDFESFSPAISEQSTGELNTTSFSAKPEAENQSITTPVEPEQPFTFDFDNTDFEGLGEIFSTAEVDRQIAQLQQQILPEIPTELSQFEAVPLPNEIAVTDAELLSRIAPPTPIDTRLPAMESNPINTDYAFSNEDLGDIEALFNNLGPISEPVLPSYQGAAQVLDEPAELKDFDFPAQPEISQATLHADPQGEMLALEGAEIRTEPGMTVADLDAAIELQSETGFVPTTTAEDVVAINAALTNLPGFEKLTPEEAAMLAEGGFDFASFAEADNDGEDSGFGFDAAPMWLAEGQADIDRLGEILNLSEQPEQIPQIRQISSTLRKAAELMDLNEISNQLNVIETMAGMLLSGDLPESNNSLSMLKGAYADLLSLLEPYAEAARSILNPTASNAPEVIHSHAPHTKDESDVTATEIEAENSNSTDRQPSTSWLAEVAALAATPTHDLPSQTAPVGVEVDKELAEVFAAEAQEHIQNLDTRLAALEKDPHNLELIREIRRTAHTLKGSAAMVGFNVISQTGHLMEDLLDKLFDGSLEINPSIVELLFATFNAMDTMVREVATGQPEKLALFEALRPRYNAVLETEVEEEQGGAVIFERSGTGQLGIATESATDILQTVEPEGASETLNAGQDATATSLGTAFDTELVVRVPISRLDAMMNQIGELVINRTVLEQRNQVFNRTMDELSLSLRRLQRISRELETRYEVELLKSSNIREVGVPVAVGSSNGGSNYLNFGGLPAASEVESEFDTLEMDRYTEFHTLSREMSETVSDLATVQREFDNLRDDLDNLSVQQSRLTDDLQDRLVKIRLVPLSNLTPRLYRTVRTVAASESKEIEFVVSGDTTQVDKTIFEEIGDPLLHLIRNAVDHGVESPQERQAAGKKPVATIGFAARSEGSDVVIEVSDDGRGIDTVSLKQQGIERGFLSADAQPSEEDLYNLMFMPGFSTSVTISEISGRGVGLDVVRANISRLKGMIEIASQPGQGTTFSIRLPNTLAISRALLVKSAGYVYAIPLNVIEETTRLEQNLLIPSSEKYGRGSYYRFNGETLPLYDLSDLLHLPTHARKEPDMLADEEASSGGTKRERPLLIIGGAQRYALTMDNLEGQQEVVVKNMGSHLKTVRGVVGATTLGSGQVILILNVYELLNRGSQRQISGFVPGGVRSSDQMLKMEGRVLSEDEIKERELADLRSRIVPGEVRPAFVPPTKASKPKVRRTPIIQVVDDSLSIRKVLSGALEKAGFRVRTSKDGQEALETIQQNAPDLIIMDIEMPRMDGYQLTYILKNEQAFQAIPIVMLTSRAGLKHRQKAEEVGADGFLVKPYKEEELLGIVSQLLLRNS